MRGKAVLSMLLMAAITMAGACGPGAPDESQPPLQSTSWKLGALGTEGDLSPALAEPEATIEFDAGEVSGTASCNQYFGSYSAEADGSFSVAEVEWTEMACTQPGVMEQEKLFLDILLSAHTYDVTSASLTITGTEGQLLFSAD
ncbi:MAG: META domain-containing protein [Chloroflexota bacterium]